MEGGMRIVLALGVVALAAGCDGNAVDEETDVEDTDVIDDTDPVGDTDDTDPGDTDDTDEVPFDGMEIEVSFDQPVGASWRMVAYLCTFDADFGLVPVREAAAAPYDGSPSILGVPTPDAGDTGPLFEDAEGAFYVVYAYDDADGDGVHDTTELIVGASRQYLLYLADAGSTGLSTGWEGLAMIPGQPGPLPYDPADGFDLQDLQPVEQITVGGTVDASVPASADGLASLSLYEDEGLLPNRPIDQRLEDPFTATIDGAIDPGRTQTTDYGLGVGVDYLLAYQDVDSSGDVNFGDQAQGYACYDNKIALLYWIDGVTRVDQAFVLLGVDLHTGWQLTVVTGSGEAPVRLNEIEAQALVILPDSACGAP